MEKFFLNELQYVILTLNYWKGHFHTFIHLINKYIYIRVLLHLFSSLGKYPEMSEQSVVILMDFNGEHIGVLIIHSLHQVKHLTRTSLRILHFNGINYM